MSGRACNSADFFLKASDALRFFAHQLGEWLSLSACL